MNEKIFATRELNRCHPGDVLEERREVLAFYDWQWTLRTEARLVGDGCYETQRSELISVDHAFRWLENNDQEHKANWPKEIFFHLRFKDGLFVSFPAKKQNVKIELSGWELIGSLGKQDVCTFGDIPHSVVHEDLLSASGKYLLISQVLYCEADRYGPVHADLLTRQQAAEWYFDNNLETPEALLPLVKDRILTVDTVDEVLSASNELCLGKGDSTALDDVPVEEAPSVDSGLAGVSVYDVGLHFEGEVAAARSWSKRFIDSKSLTAHAIGKCPNDGRARLYDLSELLSDVRKHLGLSGNEKAKLFRWLNSRKRPPKK